LPSRAGPPPSHRILEDLADLDPSDAEIANRLLRSREGQRRQQNQQLSEEVKKLSMSLLQNQEFIDSLKNSLGPDDLNRLGKRVLGGEDLFSDPAIRKLLADDSLRKHLKGNEDLVKRWVEANPPSPGPDPVNPGTSPDRTEQPPEPSDPPPAPGESGPRRPDAAPSGDDWLKERLEGWVDSVEGWAQSPSGQSLRDSLLNLTRRRPGESALGADLLERARQLGQRLPRLDKAISSNLGWRGSALPRLGSPNLGLSPSVPSVPDFSARDASRGASTVLVVVVCVVLAVLVARTAHHFWHERLGGGGNWNLGPWPVRPQEVANREELVRAFEYLALLCLGPQARTRHHLELAEQLGAQPTLDPDRRRQAAEFLAGLYERARYAPQEETLPPEDLAAARRTLCYLAGVASP